MGIAGAIISPCTIKTRPRGSAPCEQLSVGMFFFGYALDFDSCSFARNASQSWSKLVPSWHGHVAVRKTKSWVSPSEVCLVDQAWGNDKLWHGGSNGTDQGGTNLHFLKCGKHQKWSVQLVQYVRPLAVILLMWVLCANVLGAMF